MSQDQDKSAITGDVAENFSLLKHSVLGAYFAIALAAMAGTVLFLAIHHIPWQTAFAVTVLAALANILAVGLSQRSAARFLEGGRDHG
jgi:hypothetical protein